MLYALSLFAAAAAPSRDAKILSAMESDLVIAKQLEDFAGGIPGSLKSTQEHVAVADPDALLANPRVLAATETSCTYAKNAELLKNIDAACTRYAAMRAIISS